MPCKKTSNSICGFEKKSLDAIKTHLERLLNRENILDSVVIQECFNKDVLGFSLESVSKLEELKKTISDLIGKDLSSSNKDLMLAISLGAELSETLNLSICPLDENEVNLDTYQSTEKKRLSENEHLNGLADTSKLIMELVETGREKDIFIKPIFKAERATLILRELENDVTEDEIFDLLKKFPHFYSEETRFEDKTNAESVKKLVVNFRKEVHGTWFITLKTEDLTTKVALWLRGQKLRESDSSTLRVGIKSEHPIASLLSVLSMNKGFQSLGNRMRNLQISSNEMGIGFPTMITTLHTPISKIPATISGNELGNLSAVKGVDEAISDDLSSHRGALLGNVNPKMGYMVNIPTYSNTGFINAHSQINGATSENDQSSQDVRDEPQMGMENLNCQIPEHIAAALPVMYSYNGNIGRAIGVPNHASPLNVFAPIPGAPNGGIITPIMVMPGTAVPGVHTSPPSPVLGIGSPNAFKSDVPEATKSQKESIHNVRAPGVSETSDSVARGSSPCSMNRRNSSEEVANTLSMNEVDYCGGSPIADNINPVVRGIPHGGTTMIHGIAPFYYGVSGIPEIQPVNLQCLGSGPHPGSHHHIFIHGNPQFQYQHQAETGISGSAVQGDSVNFESVQSSSKPNSATSEGNVQHNTHHVQPVFSASYYHNAQNIGNEHLVTIEDHLFASGNFVNNSGGNNIGLPVNLHNQSQNYWLRSPSNSNNNAGHRYKSNNRKNNSSVMGNRSATKSGPGYTSSKKNNHPKTSSIIGGANSENSDNESKSKLKTGAALLQSPNNEVNQHEQAEQCSASNSKQHLNCVEVNVASSTSQGPNKSNSSTAGDSENIYSPSTIETNQNSSSKKPSSNLSMAQTNEIQERYQTSNKTFKTLSNSGNRSRSNKNAKKSSSGNETSGGRGYFDHNGYRTNVNNDKPKFSTNVKGTNGSNNLAVYSGANYHHRRRASKQINTSGSGRGDIRNSIQGKYNGYENGHLRVKYTAESEQSHFNFNTHGKHSGSYLDGNNGHVNQKGSQKIKVNSARSNDQDDKKKDLDNFPSLFDALATKK